MRCRAAKIFGVTQPRVSDLMRGKINTFVDLASSAALLAELQGVLMREKFAAQLSKRGLR